MYEEQRKRVLRLALRVNVVNVQSAKTVNVDIPRELWQFVDPRLGSPPIKPVLPPSNKSAHVRERGSVLPICFVEFVWEAGEVQFLAPCWEYVRERRVIGFRVSITSSTR